jgi:membrane associated rhomboid family serine protease
MAMLGYLTKNPSFQAVGKQFAILILANLVINLFQPAVGIFGHIGGVTWWCSVGCALCTENLAV